MLWYIFRFLQKYEIFVDFHSVHSDLLFIYMISELSKFLYKNLISENSFKMNPQGMLGLERPYLRARRRVRQRVDAGEPRNSYSSIPGFSFRTNSGPNVSTTPPINSAVTPP